MENVVQEDRKRRIAGRVLIFLPGLAVAVSAMLKFAGVPAVVHQMAAEGFSGGKLTLVAALELPSALLFIYPRSRSLGLLLLSAFLGGAICTHVQMGDYGKALGPAVFLSLAWVGIWLRHPQALWSLEPVRTATPPRVENKGESWASRSA